MGTSRRGEWRRYEPGEIVGAAQVVGCVEDGGTQRTTWYQIRYTCCGREDRVTHLNLYKRNDNGAKRCIQCWAGPNAKAPTPRRSPTKERIPEWTKLSDADIDGVRCASGFWPKLGPMGFRGLGGVSAIPYIRIGASYPRADEDVI